MNEKIPEEAIGINPGALDFNFQKAAAGLRGGLRRGLSGRCNRRRIDLGRGWNGRDRGDGRRGRGGGGRASICRGTIAPERPYDSIS